MYRLELASRYMPRRMTTKREFEYNEREKIDGNENQLAYIRPDVN